MYVCMDICHMMCILCILEHDHYCYCIFMIMNCVIGFELKLNALLVAHESCPGLTAQA